MKKTLVRVATVKKATKPGGEAVVDRFKLGLEVVKLLLQLHGLHWF